MEYHGTETEIRVEKAAAHEVEERLGADAIFQAKNASDAEHSETIFQAFKNNRKAVLWSVAISMSVVMEGYDTILMVSRLLFLCSPANTDCRPGQLLRLSRIPEEVWQGLRR